MKPLSTSPVQARERRERYCALRREGMAMADAAAGAGVNAMDTGARYERWYQAVKSGEVIVPGRPGRPPPH